MSDEKKRAMMAAHLGEHLSHLLRGGDIDGAKELLPCTKRTPLPAVSERDKCRAWGCNGCGECVSWRYIP